MANDALWQNSMKRITNSLWLGFRLAAQPSYSPYQEQKIRHRSSMTWSPLGQWGKIHQCWGWRIHKKLLHVQPLHAVAENIEQFPHSCKSLSQGHVVIFPVPFSSWESRVFHLSIEFIPGSKIILQVTCRLIANQFDLQQLRRRRRGRIGGRRRTQEAADVHFRDCRGYSVRLGRLDGWHRT